jgi:hypothetical protein|tara:strand:+ start:3438 stop:3728 length:291 start_codon:yes stop_codon:yes gene_type:complete
MTQTELFSNAGVTISRSHAGGVWKMFIDGVCVDQRRLKRSLTKFARRVVEEANRPGGNKDILLTCRMIQNRVYLHPTIADYIRCGPPSGVTSHRNM